MNRSTLALALITLTSAALPVFAQGEKLDIEVKNMNVFPMALHIYDQNGNEEETIAIEPFENREYTRQTTGDYQVKVSYGFTEPWACKEEGSGESAIIGSQDKKIILEDIMHNGSSSYCLLSIYEENFATLDLNFYVHGLSGQTGTFAVLQFDEDGEQLDDLTPPYSFNENGWPVFEVTQTMLEAYNHANIVFSIDGQEDILCRFGEDGPANIYESEVHVAAVINETDHTCNLSENAPAQPNPPPAIVTLNTDIYAKGITGTEGEQFGLYFEEYHSADDRLLNREEVAGITEDHLTTPLLALGQLENTNYAKLKVFRKTENKALGEITYTCEFADDGSEEIRNITDNDRVFLYFDMNRDEFKRCLLYKEKIEDTINYVFTFNIPEHIVYILAGNVNGENVDEKDGNYGGEEQGVEVPLPRDPFTEYSYVKINPEYSGPLATGFIDCRFDNGNGSEKILADISKVYVNGFVNDNDEFECTLSEEVSK